MTSPDGLNKKIIKKKPCQAPRQERKAQRKGRMSQAHSKTIPSRAELSPVSQPGDSPKKGPKNAGRHRNGSWAQNKNGNKGSNRSGDAHGAGEQIKASIPGKSTWKFQKNPEKPMKFQENPGEQSLLCLQHTPQSHSQGFSALWVLEQEEFCSQ